MDIYTFTTYLWDCVAYSIGILFAIGDADIIDTRGIKLEFAPDAGWDSYIDTRIRSKAGINGIHPSKVPVF